jgi:hypothetical protein
MSICTYYDLLRSILTSSLYSTVDKFIAPDWGDKVNSGIRLLYQHERLHGLAGRYAGVNFIPPVMDSEYGFGTSTRMFYWN